MAFAATKERKESKIDNMNRNVIVLIVLLAFLAASFGYFKYALLTKQIILGQTTIASPSPSPMLPSPSILPTPSPLPTANPILVAQVLKTLTAKQKISQLVYSPLMIATASATTATVSTTLATSSAALAVVIKPLQMPLQSTTDLVLASLSASASATTMAQITELASASAQAITDGNDVLIFGSNIKLAQVNQIISKLLLIYQGNSNFKVVADKHIEHVINYKLSN